MKIYEVCWYIVSNSGNGVFSSIYNGSYDLKNKRTFSSREKAEDFFNKIREAAQLLNLIPTFNCDITEVEIE